MEVIMMIENQINDNIFLSMRDQNVFICLQET